MISITVNGQRQDLEAEPEIPLLWILRDHLQLTGTKFSCGIGECGACTVHLDGKAVRSCQVSLKEAAGHVVTTVEGLPEDHPVKKAWIAEQVPQCGYCQPGQIMQAAAFLAATPNPTDEQIVVAMNGNLCRCGTYGEIKMAVRRAASAPSLAPASLSPSGRPTADGRSK